MSKTPILNPLLKSDKKMTLYEIHAFATLFPPMNDKELEKLVLNIQKNGLLVPIKLYEGKIIDGRNRYRACIYAEVDPIFENVTPENPLLYVLAQNQARRHLTTSQRAWAAVTIAEMQNCTPSIAAQMMQIGTRTFASAIATKKTACLRLQKAIQEGRIPVSTGSRIAKESLSNQEDITMLSKKDRNAALKYLENTKKDPTERKVSSTIPLTKEEYSCIRAAALRNGQKGNIEEFVRDIVLAFCENDPSTLEHTRSGVTSAKVVYSDKEQEVDLDGYTFQEWETEMVAEYDGFMPKAEYLRAHNLRQAKLKEMRESKREIRNKSALQ